MAGRRRHSRTDVQAGPIPLAPIDLLAGIGPGVELCADDVPAGLDDDADGAATLGVAEAGRQLRAGDATVRRLIRTPVIEPARTPGPARTEERDRAGVVPRTRIRPGE